MPKYRPSYPSEHRAELVRLVREEGRSPTELAREFEPSAQSIVNWVAQADIDTGLRDGLTTDESVELKKLRSIKFMCDGLGVTRQGIFAWRKRLPYQRPVASLMALVGRTLDFEPAERRGADSEWVRRTVSTGDTGVAD